MFPQRGQPRTYEMASGIVVWVRELAQRRTRFGVSNADLGVKATPIAEP